MSIVQLRIPYKFAREWATLGWRDIRFGVLNGLLDPRAPVEHAIELLADQAPPSAAVLELAIADINEPTENLIERLADSEPMCEDCTIREKWLLVVLAWIYEHREEFPDPLQKVEEVYADFGYPEEIADFVRYMPMIGPDLGSQEANERRLLERWGRYVSRFAGRHRQ